MTIRVDLSSGACRSGKPADHGIGRQMHDRGKDDQPDDRAALAPAAGRHHRQPFAPCQPDFVPGKPGQGRGGAHAAAASTSTSAMNMSSRLVSFLPFCWRNSVKRAFGDKPSRRDDADAVGHAFGHFQNMRGHDHGAAGAHAFLQQSLDVARGYGVEAGERFIQDDQPRVVHQRSGQRHLLAHALGKSLAALVQMRLQPERDQQTRARTVPRPRDRCPRGRRRIRDIPAASACRRSSARPIPRP